MSFFEDIVQRGTRAAQPAANTVIIGTIYYVTDENVTERSNGSAWEDMTDAGGSGYTDEQAQDAVGSILTDTATIDATYNDAGPSITLDVKSASITEAMQVLADNTTQNATSTKHGYVPKTPGSATQFLNGAATAAFAAVKDSDLSTSDITTNDVSTTKHGFVPKAPNDTSKFLRGDATWAAPAAAASGMTLVEKKTVTAAATTVTFSGLAGDTDDTYLLEGRIIIPSGGTPFFTWQPNAVATNQTSIRAYANGGSFATSTRSDLQLLQGVGGTVVDFLVKISAKKDPHSVAANRVYHGLWHAQYSAAEAIGIMGGQWAETATEITSIVIVSDTASKIGDGSEFALYKLAQS